MTDIHSLYCTPGYEDPANFVDIPFESQIQDLSDDFLFSLMKGEGYIGYNFGFLESPKGPWYDRPLPSWVRHLADEVAASLSLDIESDAAEGLMLIHLSGEETDEEIRTLSPRFDAAFKAALHRVLHPSL